MLYPPHMWASAISIVSLHFFSSFFHLLVYCRSHFSGAEAWKYEASDLKTRDRWQVVMRDYGAVGDSPGGGGYQVISSASASPSASTVVVVWLQPHLLAVLLCRSLLQCTEGVWYAELAFVIFVT